MSKDKWDKESQWRINAVTALEPEQCYVSFQQKSERWRDRRGNRGGGEVIATIMTAKGQIIKALIQEVTTVKMVKGEPGWICNKCGDGAVWGYQPKDSNLDQDNPPKGGSGVSDNQPTVQQEPESYFAPMLARQAAQFNKALAELREEFTREIRESLCLKISETAGHELSALYPDVDVEKELKETLGKSNAKQLTQAIAEMFGKQVTEQERKHEEAWDLYQRLGKGFKKKQRERHTIQEGPSKGGTNTTPTTPGPTDHPVGLKKKGEQHGVSIVTQTEQEIFDAVQGLVRCLTPQYKVVKIPTEETTEQRPLPTPTPGPGKPLKKGWDQTEPPENPDKKLIDLTIREPGLGEKLAKQATEQ